MENQVWNNIQAFRKKFYFNKIIRGSILLLLIISSLLFVTILGEGLLGFSAGVRTVLVVVLGLTFLTVLSIQVLWPWSKILNLSKSLTDKEIAVMIKRHFPDINDKLINLIQLKESSNLDNALVAAAIEEKTRTISPVPFATAINLKVNWKFARYLAIPAALFLLLLILSPTTFNQGTFRLINFDQEFIPPPPFRIHVQNRPAELIAGQDFHLSANVKGNELPANLYMYVKHKSETEFVAYPMKQDALNRFSYEFEDVKENFDYFIGNEEVRDDIDGVEVIERPSIRNFSVVLEYPGYTGMGRDTLESNIGDFRAPKGTKAKWMLDANGNLDRAVFVGSDTTRFKSVDGHYEYEKGIFDKENYFISLTSERKIQNNDTARYGIEVLEDRYPSVYVKTETNEFQADFNMSMPLDFEISDDYGFSALGLYYRYTKSNNPDKVKEEYEVIPLSVASGEKLQFKSLELDLDVLGMEEGDLIEYFVKVFDNDRVTGPKFSVSANYKINYASIDEKYNEAEESREEIKEDLKRLEDKIKKLKDGLDKMDRMMLEEKNLSYEDKKEIKSILQQSENIRSEINSIQEKFQQNKEMMENNSMISEQTRQKYEQLNQYLKDMDNPYVEQKLKELGEKFNELDPEELKTEMEDLKVEEEEILESLERTEALINELEIEGKMEEVGEKLKNLKTQQDILKEKTENASKEELKELADKQEELKSKMDSIRKDMKELGEMKEKSSKKDSEIMKEMQQDAKDAGQEMENASDQMNQQDSQSGSESQENASDKMQKMMDQMSAMQFGNQQQQAKQNLDNLRDILENLLKLSFDQEDLRNEMKKLSYRDPELPKKETEQKQLLDDMYMVKDSLDELAKKVFQIEKYVLDESNKIVESMKSARGQIERKDLAKVMGSQQASMTSLNNLANMLSEVMSPDATADEI